MFGRIRVAAVQAEPKWLNLSAGVEQAIGLIEEAADGGAQLVAFPETFLPGFPWWMWLNSVDWGEEFLARYLANSLTADGPELRAIAYAARRKGIHVSIGFAERAGREVFMSQALVDVQGEIAVARKGEPTGLERTVFSAADDQVLVRDTEHGRIGVLGGADHMRPALRARMHDEREQIHIASWSGFTVYYGEGKEWGPELNTAASVRYAMDGAAYVIAPVAVVPVAGWEVVDARLPGRAAARWWRRLPHLRPRWPGTGHPPRRGRRRPSLRRPRSHPWPPRRPGHLRRARQLPGTERPDRPPGTGARRVGRRLSGRRPTWGVVRRFRRRRVGRSVAGRSGLPAGPLRPVRNAPGARSRRSPP
ncbi:nitrilase-related carbon-nitrogen hydrolase [Nocardia sp. MW-W600-9]